MGDACQILRASQRQATADGRYVMQAQVRKLKQDMAKREGDHRQEVDELVKREEMLSKALQARKQEIKELKRSKQS